MIDEIDLRRREVLSNAVGVLGLATLANASVTSVGMSQGSYGILGESAPELDVDFWIDAEGESSNFSIAESKGKWVVLKCFQNWCPGCHTTGFPSLKVFTDRFSGNPNVAIAGIQTVFEGFDSNTKESVRAVQIEYELPIVMGHDAGSPNANRIPMTMRNYRTGGTPWFILINPEGIVVFNDFRVKTGVLIEYISRQLEIEDS